MRPTEAAQTAENVLPESPPKVLPERVRGSACCGDETKTSSSTPPRHRASRDELCGTEPPTPSRPSDSSRRESLFSSTHTRAPSWDAADVAPPPEAKEVPRQPRSMPSLGAMMHPDIGLAGSITGKGAFRRQFAQVKRQSAVRQAFSGDLPCVLPPSGAVAPGAARLGEQSCPELPNFGLRLEDSTRADSPSPAPESPKGSVPGARRKFVVNAKADGAEARPGGAKSAKGRFVVQASPSWVSKEAGAWDRPISGPIDSRQGTLVSRQPRRKFEVKDPGRAACAPAFAPAPSIPPAAPAAPRAAVGAPERPPAGAGAPPGVEARPVGQSARASQCRSDGLPAEDGVGLLCESAASNSALLQAWAAGCTVAPPTPAETIVALLEAQRDMLVVENVALRQLNVSLRQAKGARGAPGSVGDAAQCGAGGAAVRRGRARTGDG